jgi:exopolyphosphatase/guanosine-5'-triphosphate,3'-diphosphate pyrophosphatase
MQKIAAIDTGSNALRLVVANLDETWRVEPVESVRIPVRLGQDVFTNSVLGEATIQQTVDAFTQFRRITDDFGVSRMRAVATSAVREAQNSEILIDRIARVSGINLEVISGEEEARLVHIAVANAMDLDDKRAVLVDIGGGSVEVTITKGGNILSTNSYNLGTVRLLQRLHWDNGALSTRTFSLLLHEYTEASRHRMEKDIGTEKVDMCIATGGNVEEIGKLRQKLFKRDNDRSVTMAELIELIERLSWMDDRERIQKLNLRPDRADVILPAAVVLHLVASIAGVKEIAIPNVGVKNGILLDMSRNMAQELHLPDRNQVWESAVRIGEKYHFDMEHASFVSKLAGQFFDQSRALHLLEEEQRLTLEIGALLHDIGHFINTVDHDQHGYYLLKANHIIGLSEHQQDMVACIVMFHRKGFPYEDKSIPLALSQKDRLTLTKLCALLRLADALDASHIQKINKATLNPQKTCWSLKLEGSSDLTLEKWSVLKRRTLFQEIFGSPLEIEE